MTREDLEVTRWRGFSHAELYAQLHNGPGASASAVPSRRWADLASTLHDIGQDMAKAITDAKSSWSGTAANSAFAQLGQVAAWASQTGEGAAKMRTSVEQQADHIGRARAAMPAPGEEPTPKPDPLIAPVTQLLGLQKDHEPIERATTEAARRAYEVMLAYQNDTTTTADALARFEEPVDTTGTYRNTNRNRGGVRNFSHHHTETSSAGLDFTRGNDHHQGRRHWDFSPRVSQSGAEFLATPEHETRARPVAPPLQQGAMTGAGPVASPVAATPQRDQAARSKGSPGSGRITGSLSPLDTNAIPGAPPPASAALGSHVTPAAATPAGTGSADRVVPRRMGEPLIPNQWMNEAAEPAGQAKRRRNRREDEKITESVEGAGSEVPPSVIGNGPYRQ